ncbi:MAG: entericidin A/B family lipoprotein [Alphaproteobacteria bacterium]|nr:entericidin A/B family lipoprotein [Alphaproteobacteria bacterium]
MRILLSLILLSGFAASLSACNTVDGFGQDLEKAGENIQKNSK